MLAFNIHREKLLLGWQLSSDALHIFVYLNFLFIYSNTLIDTKFQHQMTRLLVPICLANFQSRVSRTQVPDARRSNPLRFQHFENC